MVHMETCGYFYKQNCFVQVRGCFQETLETASLQFPVIFPPDSPHRWQQRAFDRKFAMVVEIDGTEMGEPDFKKRLGGKTVVFALKHFLFFMTLLKHDGAWGELPERIKMIAFSFTLRNSKFAYLQTPRDANDIKNALRLFQGFFTLPNLIQNTIYRMDWADDTQHELFGQFEQCLQPPMPTGSLFKDFESLLRAANELRGASKPEMAISLYNQVLQSFDDIRLHRNFHGYSISIAESLERDELFRADLRVQRGICYLDDEHFEEAAEDFDYAIESNSRLGQYVYSDEQLAIFCILCGQALVNAYLEQGDPQMLQEAISRLEEARGYRPGDERIEAKIQEVEEMLE